MKMLRVLGLSKLLMFLLVATGHVAYGMNYLTENSSAGDLVADFQDLDITQNRGKKRVQGITPPSDYSMEGCSSSEESVDREINAVLLKHKKLKLRFSTYEPIKKIMEITWSPYWCDADDWSAERSRSMKNTQLNELDQGWLVFKIIQKIVNAYGLINEVTDGSNKVDKDLFHAINRLKSTIEEHKTRLLAIIANFDRTACHRLFWLLVDKYCACLAENPKEFSRWIAPLVSENSYSFKRGDWEMCVRNCIVDLPKIYKNKVKEILCLTIQLPDTSKFYVYLG